jgi:hypothetical protein
VISDAGNCRLVRVGARGRMRRFAGSGSTATCRQEIDTWMAATPHAPPGPARCAALAVPGYLAVRGHTVFVADLLHSVVRRVEHGWITTVAGRAGKPRFADGPAKRVARLAWPSGLWASATRLLVTDPGNNRVRSMPLPPPGPGPDGPTQC